jgi:hypothetical protein
MVELNIASPPMRHSKRKGDSLGFMPYLPYPVLNHKPVDFTPSPPHIPPGRGIPFGGNADIIHGAVMAAMLLAEENIWLKLKANGKQQTAAPSGAAMMTMNRRRPIVRAYCCWHPDAAYAEPPAR